MSSHSSLSQTSLTPSMYSSGTSNTQASPSSDSCCFPEDTHRQCDGYSKNRDGMNASHANKKTYPYHPSCPAQHLLRPESAQPNPRIQKTKKYIAQNTAENPQKLLRMHARNRREFWKSIRNKIFRRKSEVHKNESVDEHDALNNTHPPTHSHPRNKQRKYFLA